MPLAADDAKALRKQIEFYFSDVNVVKDAFLKAKMAESPEGWIPLAVLLTFNRVAKITKAAEDLREALRGSDELVVDEEAMKVRRTRPIPADIEMDSRTIYAKPIPPTDSLETVTAFFEKCGKVLAVWRRYFPGGKEGNRVKPSVFVVFDSVDTVTAVLANPPTYGDTVLEVCLKEAYLQRKAAEIAQRHATTTKATVTRPPMPTGASYEVTGVGTMERFGDIKKLWPSDEQKGVRYIFTPSPEVVQVVFQSADVGKEMVASVTSRGITLNGQLPTFTAIEGEKEVALLKAVEEEIKGREEHRAAQGNAGRGRGGGRGRGRGGGKRPRQ